MIDYYKARTEFAQQFLITIPDSDGLQPNSNGLRPNSDGLQPNSNGLRPTSDGLQPNVTTELINPPHVVGQQGQEDMRYYS